MGGWAVYSNANYPMPAPLWAGFVQGCLSACLTLVLKKSVDYMRPNFPGLLGYVLPAFIASLCSTGLLIAAHIATGTPEVLMTIALPLCVSSSYVFAYNILQHHMMQGRPHD